MTKEILVVIASLLAVVGNIPYLFDVVKGRVKPHPYTWLVWTIVSCVVFFGQVAKGAGIGAIPTAVAEVFTLLIFIFSLKYGFKNPPRIDKFFLALAIAGIIPWILTKDPTISVIIVVSIDLLAYIPTLRKTFKNPKSETPFLYSTNILRQALTLGALKSYNIATMLHSIVMIITHSLMVFFITMRRKEMRKE